MKYRNGWFQMAKGEPWVHLVVNGDKHYRNGTECEPFDFREIYRTAYRCSDVSVNDDDD